MPVSAHFFFTFDEERLPCHRGPVFLFVRRVRTLLLGQAPAHPTPATTFIPQAMAGAIRERDTSRLVTWASNRIENDINLNLTDVVSFNNYPGWYSGTPADVNR